MNIDQPGVANARIPTTEKFLLVTKSLLCHDYSDI